MNYRDHYIQRNGPRWSAPEVTLDKAKNGMWTAFISRQEAPPFYIHSRYDPLVEAERFVSAQVEAIEEGQVDRIVLYGIGCGHSLRALLAWTEGKDIHIEVWESNVAGFVQMEEAGVFDAAFDITRVTLIISDDLQIYAKRVNEWKNSNVHVIIHEPSLRAMPLELQPLKDVLLEYQLLHNSVIANKELLHHNFSQNNRQEWPSLSVFQNISLSVPAILISAGPSLSKNISLLPAAAKTCLLGAVGTASSLLIRQGIQPDFIVMTDPQKGMLRQIEGWEAEGIPLFFLSTMHSPAVEQYNGPKFILYQQGFTPAEKTASLRGEPTLHTGGSVSTTLFSLARLMGMRPLCLVGQDLAYTDNRTHVEGTHQFQQWSQEAVGESVLSFDRSGTVVSPRNMLLVKKWFEEQVRSSNNKDIYNATEGGVHIEGFTHVTLSDFLAIAGKKDIGETRELFRRLANASTS